MAHLILLVLLLLLWPAGVGAQTQGIGYQQSDDCARIPNKVANKLLCWNNITQVWAYWNGSTLVPLTGAASGVITLNGLLGGVSILGTAADISVTTLSPNITLDLINTAVTPGAYGSSTLIPVLTIDAKGRITAATTAGVVGGVSSVTGTASNISATPTTGAVVVDLVSTAVTPGTYGSATQVGQFTVDAKGRLTFAQNVAISGGTITASGPPVIHQLGVWTSATNLTGVPVGTTGQVLAGVTGADPAFTATPVVTSLQGIIGNVTPAAGSFTTITASGDITTQDTHAIGAITNSQYIQFRIGSPAVNVNNGRVYSAASGNQQGIQLFVGSFTPGLGSTASMVGVVAPFTINGTSSGRATAFAVPVVTGTLAGGTVLLADFGTTTTDYFTGYTSKFKVDVSGALTSAGTAFTLNATAVKLGDTVTIGAAPTGAAGGVLSGTYPNPGVAAQTGTGSVFVMQASPTLTPAANAIALTVSGYSLTGSATNSMASWAGTLNTSGVVHVNDWSIVDTAHGTGSTFFRIRAGTSGVTEVLSLDPLGVLTVSYDASQNPAVHIRRSDNLLGLDLWAASGSGPAHLDSLWDDASATGGFIFRTRVAGTPVTALQITGAGLLTSANTAMTVNGTAIKLGDTVTLANANLTGPITSVGNATSVAAQTGTGSVFVMQASPTLTTPILGVAAATSTTHTGTGGAGFMEVVNQSSAPSTPTTAIRFYADASNRFSWKGTNGFVRTFDGTANTADRLYTLPDLAGTVALTANKLSVFAATTSAELAGVISDETGSGLLVFATSPTLTTPVLGVAAATSVTAGSVVLNSSGLTLVNANTVGIASDTLLTFSAFNASGASALSMNEATTTQTSGSQNLLRILGTFNPASGSLVGRGIYLNPTVNFVSGTGSYAAFQADVIETAVTGTNYLLRLRAGAAGTTDEFTVTNAGVVTAAGTISATTGFMIGGVAATGTFPRGNGTHFVASTVTIPDTFTTGGTVVATGTNVLGVVAAGTTGQYFRAVTSGAPIWSTLTLPNAATTGDLFYASATNAMAALTISATPGTFLRSTATLPAWSTLVLPNAATTGGLFAVTGTNVMGVIAAPAASGQILVSVGGSTLPTWQQNLTVGSGASSVSISLNGDTGTNGGSGITFYNGGVGAQAIIGLYSFIETGAYNADLEIAAIAGANIFFKTSNTRRMTLNAGLQMGAPTGGDKGAGTLNAAGAYYANGTVGVSQTFTMCKTGACATTCTIIVTTGIVTGGTC